MSGIFLLDWLTLAVSLFNTVILFWLGLTVLLNAERRHAGIWLAGGGPLVGGVFFLSHTAILGVGLYNLRAGDFWWRIGWIPVIFSPFAWYVVMLWYAGFWEGRGNPIARRHRPWLWLLTGSLVVLVAMIFIAGLLPSFGQVARLEPAPSTAMATGRPVLLLYSVFIVACIGLTLDALLRPGPTQRMMGGLARQRARPWLAAASFALLTVGLLVAGFLWWAAFQPPNGPLHLGLGPLITALDLLISALIATAVLLTGQAVAEYEIFTGKTLPRRGLQRYWKRAVILAAGYSGVVSLSLTMGLPAIYSLLLTGLLMMAFYALLGWRSYAERQRLLSDLRPFIASPGLFGQLLEAGEPARPAGVQPAFEALCSQVLNTTGSALRPAGPMAPLFGDPLFYRVSEGNADLFLAKFRPPEVYSPDVLCIAVEGGWAVPLWNERGLCGVLLLGEKLDGAPYTEEEIEVARAACERLVDLQASAEMARRLMALQRQHYAESHVIDRRTRRTIHDEVLPRLHAALLSVTENSQAGPETSNGQEEQPQALLMDVHRRLSSLLRDLPTATTPEAARLGLVEALRQVVEEEYRHAFDGVGFEVTFGTDEWLRGISPVRAETVYYAAREAVRNAAQHARPADAGAKLHLTVQVSCSRQQLEVLVQDNGVGMPVKAPAPTEGGSGYGLALHSTLLAVLGGSLAVESTPGAWTRVRINVPVEA